MVHPGMSASALQSSFVVGWDSSSPAAATRLDHLLAHELVHGWVHLDGEPDSVTWFDEGSADYFATVLRFRREVVATQATWSQPPGPDQRTPASALEPGGIGRMTWPDDLAG